MEAVAAARPDVPEDADDSDDSDDSDDPVFPYGHGLDVRVIRGHLQFPRP